MLIHVLGKPSARYSYQWKLMLPARCLHIIRWVSLANRAIRYVITTVGGRQGTRFGERIMVLLLAFCIFPFVVKEWYQSSIYREMRKTENEQEGAHKTTQAGHSANPFMVSGCLFTAFYQVIILGDNLSDKLPLGKFSIISEKDVAFRGEKCCPWRCEMYARWISSSFLLRTVWMLPFQALPDRHRPEEIYISRTRGNSPTSE